MQQDTFLRHCDFKIDEALAQREPQHFFFWRTIKKMVGRENRFYGVSGWQSFRETLDIMIEENQRDTGFPAVNALHARTLPLYREVRALIG